MNISNNKTSLRDETNDGEGVCIPIPIRAQESNSTCCGRFIWPEGQGLNQQGKVIKLPVVMERTALSRTSIYSLAKQGLFPAPIKLSVRSVGWREDDIANWINNRPQAV
jgi:prophage regulatory protein